MGGYEHLEAILLLLREAVKYNDWDYLHLISGEDYPLIAPEEMDNRLKESNEVYIWEAKATERSYPANKWYAYKWPYVRYSLNYRNRWIRGINIIAVILQMAFHIRRNRIGDIKDVYQSLIWGSYPRDAVDCILNYLDQNPKFFSDLRWCKIPEELCVGSILSNNGFLERIKNHNLRAYNRQSGDWGPRYLEETDIEMLERTDAFWCRKVKADTAVYYYLKKRLSGQLVRDGYENNR